VIFGKKNSSKALKAKMIKTVFLNDVRNVIRTLELSIQKIDPIFSSEEPQPGTDVHYFKNMFAEKFGKNM
jgi:hypothetical protein